MVKLKLSEDIEVDLSVKELAEFHRELRKKPTDSVKDDEPKRAEPKPAMPITPTEIKPPEALEKVSKLLVVEEKSKAEEQLKNKSKNEGVDTEIIKYIKSLYPKVKEAILSQPEYKHDTVILQRKVFGRDIPKKESQLFNTFQMQIRRARNEIEREQHGTWDHSKTKNYGGYIHPKEYRFVKAVEQKPQVSTAKVPNGQLNPSGGVPAQQSNEHQKTNPLETIIKV